MKRLTLLVAAALLLGAGCASAPDAAVTQRTTREVALGCTTDMATQFHIHPYLKIFVNGTQREIPAEIGITNGCMNAIHTHDATGQIHVEAPEKRDFTLGDFFAVWGQPFSKSAILDAKIDTRHVIVETVNGKESQDFESTILRDGDQIEIRYEEAGKKQ